jgi:hypothetical protein
VYWQNLCGGCLLRHCWQELDERIISAMTAWIVLIALAALFVLVVRRGRSNEPPLPPGYDGERQLAELRGIVNARTNVRLP